jgi:hypothetical protein
MEIFTKPSILLPSVSSIACTSGPRNALLWAPFPNFRLLRLVAFALALAAFATSCGDKPASKEAMLRGQLDAVLAQADSLARVSQITVDQFKAIDERIARAPETLRGHVDFQAIVDDWTGFKQKVDLTRMEQETARLGKVKELSATAAGADETTLSIMIRETTELIERQRGVLATRVDYLDRFRQRLDQLEVAG